MSESGFYGDDGSTDPFWDQLGHEEPEAEAAAEPETVTDPADERPRNPDGTFAPKTEPAAEGSTDPDDTGGAAAEGNDADTAAGPETSDAETLKAQIAQLEKRLADKDDFAGRLSNELGELRKLQEQIAAQQSRPQVSDWESLIDDNPAHAARLALQAGDQLRYQQAREAWNDLAPGAPEVFEQNLRLQQQMAELEQRFTQTTQPLQQQQQTQQVAAAYQQIQARYPDFDKLEDAMAQIVDTRPLLKKNLTDVLSSGDINEQVAFLEDLYLITAGRTSDTLRDAQKEAAQTLAQETLRAKQDAIVVSATTTAQEPAQPKTWWDEAEADEAARVAGWNIS